MITKEVIRDGIARGVVRFITDPNMESGTVCAIGETWFYFGGETAESESPEEYVKNMDSEEIVESVFATLEDFRKDNSFQDEYSYYREFLKERLADNYTCDFCGYTSLWEGHDDVRGDMWSCEKCGKVFCSECLRKAAGQKMYMRVMQQNDIITCPDCAKVIVEKEQSCNVG